jgi:hypothetical protein
MENFKIEAAKAYYLYLNVLNLPLLEVEFYLSENDNYI